MTRLLLLQNDATVGEHLRRAIAEMPGMEVAGLAVTLSQARLGMRSSPPDLVLVDLQIGAANVRELLRDIARESNGARPLVLAGALSLDDAALIEAMSLGADGYYLHGAATQDLRRAITQVLAGESPMTPAIARKARMRFDAPPARNGVGVDARTRDASRLSKGQLLMLERIGEGYLVHEVARELRTTEHEVGRGLRTLYRMLQVDRGAAATAGSPD
jgi:DNA-binding NarL/FixJ family response regulator